PGSITRTILGREVSMLPDHPVESVSGPEIEEFIARLNAANDGYHYSLPTSAEWQVVSRRAAPEPDFKDVPGRLRVGWFPENAGGTTHAVATRAPRYIEGREIWDLHGNVWEPTAWEGLPDPQMPWMLYGGSIGDATWAFVYTQKHASRVRGTAPPGWI